MNWLILAIAPGIAISLYIIFKDQYNREPRKHLIISFLLGILAIFPALIIESIFTIADEFTFFHTIQGIGIKAFFFVALVEEFCKFIMLRFYAYRKPEFDEPFDGIVYAVMVGMGFATLENIFYVSQYGMVTGVFRMFLAIPAHATFAILMGYFMGKAKFSPKRERKLMWAGLFWSILFHGSYDFFLFLQENEMVVKTFSSLLLTTGAIVSLITGIILSNKAIKSHLEFSKSTHNNHFNVYDN
jgi:RsiW-degrading membrane proteinase PrsW (M82 family)